MKIMEEFEDEEVAEVEVGLELAIHWTIAECGTAEPRSSEHRTCN